jgi:transposase
MKRKLRSYTVVCGQCGKTHTRVIRKLPKICLECRALNLKNTHKKTNRQVSEQAKEDALIKKYLNESKEELELHAFIKELSSPYFVGRFA